MYAYIPIVCHCTYYPPNIHFSTDTPKPLVRPHLNMTQNLVLRYTWGKSPVLSYLWNHLHETAKIRDLFNNGLRES
jgi:hypothetical protein